MCKTLLLLLFACAAACGLRAQEPIHDEPDEPATFPYDRENCLTFIDECARLALANYLEVTIRYDTTMGADTVIIGAVVEKDGHLSEFKVLRAKSQAASDEALRVVKGMNEMKTPWRAAWHGSGFVRSRVDIPVRMGPYLLPPPTIAPAPASTSAPALASPPAPPPAPPLPPPPGALPPREPGEEIYKVVSQMPLFPGCETLAGKERKMCAQKALMNFIYGNLRYPVEAEWDEVEGMAVVSFVIEKDGSVSYPRIARNPGSGTGEEALRVVNLMNERGIRWIPGQQNGKAVAVQFNLPVKFKLPD